MMVVHITLNGTFVRPNLPALIALDVLHASETESIQKLPISSMHRACYKY